MKKLATLTAIAVVLTAPAFAASSVDMSAGSQTSNAQISATQSITDADYNSGKTKTYHRHAHNLHAKAVEAAEKSPGTNYVVIDKNLPGDEVLATGPSPRLLPESSPNADYTGRYALRDGQTLEISGRTVYLIDAQGNRDYAPDAGYVTQHGTTFFTESGQVHRMQPRPTVLAVDTSGDNR